MPFELVIGNEQTDSKPTPVHFYLKKNGSNVELWANNEKIANPTPVLRILPSGVIELERYSTGGSSDTFFKYDNFCNGYYARVTKQ